MTPHNRKAGGAERHEPHDSLDDFPTVPWATRALCAFLNEEGYDLGLQHCWEPSANRGFMVRPLQEHFPEVFASDAHDYGLGSPVEDFLFPLTPYHGFDWIITNPPFVLGDQFVVTALERAKRGVAMLLRLQWMEGMDRYNDIFHLTPPNAVLVFSERLNLVKGRVDPKASTPMAIAWYYWDVAAPNERMGRSETIWLPPGTRARFERKSDYELPAAESTPVETAEPILA